jgi:Beta-propeller repeat/RTX calcium-binding nonapeptide repeat (4 copies)
MEQICAARPVVAMLLCGVALGLVGLALMPAGASAAPQPSSALKAEIESSYGKLPLSFEANQGQTDSQVKFLARGRGYALFLTPTEAVLSLAKPQAQTHTENSATSSPEASGTVLAMQLAGANLEPQVTGQDALPGRVNYLRGKDPAHWHTQIPTYAKVAYEGIYPGVDLVYYGNQGQLEYDFVVAPGADPGVLKLVFRGAERIEINAAGELVLSTASGDIRMHAPVIYQETAGVRTTVAGRYVLKDPQEVSFAVAAYDTSRPLVIDPVLVYSTYLGGTGGDVGDQGNGIAVDNSGNAYVTGLTQSTDFPTVYAVQPAFGGSSDAFVAKLNRNGSQLLYSTYLGGGRIDFGLGISVENRGNAYVTGFTGSTEFPTVNAVQPAFGGGADAFVTKLGSSVEEASMAMKGNSMASVGTPGPDILSGSDGDDAMYADDGRDAMDGGPGNDIMDGGPGNDIMDGGDGNDVMAGGDGNDTMRGEFGDDIMVGADGNDVMDGGDGNDVMDGGDGNDQLYSGPGDDELHGGPGADTFHVPDANMVADFNASEGDVIDLIVP